MYTFPKLKLKSYSGRAISTELFLGLLARIKFMHPWNNCLVVLAKNVQLCILTISFKCKRLLICHLSLYRGDSLDGSHLQRKLYLISLISEENISVKTGRLDFYKMARSISRVWRETVVTTIGICLPSLITSPKSLYKR